MATKPRGTVLVVDDDYGMREAIVRLLEATGYATASYASAEALLDGGGLDDAVCIVCDVKLPAMSGLDLIAALRARGRATAVVVITAHDSAGLRDEAKVRGACAFLAKPFMGAALLAAIQGAHRVPVS